MNKLFRWEIQLLATIGRISVGMFISRVRSKGKDGRQYVCYSASCEWVRLDGGITYQAHIT
jgi:hypothetical protein